MEISLNTIESKITKHADWLAFLYQITEKDIRFAQSKGLWQKYDLQLKAKLIADVVGGRTIGYNPFPEVAQYPATFNLSNAINKTSLFGAALWAAAQFDFIGSKWGEVGKKVAWGGAIGGVFDAPAPEVSGSPDRPYAPAINTITAGALNGTGRGY